MAAISRTRDLVGQTVWHWQFYYIHEGRQILTASKPGEVYQIRHNAHCRTITVGGWMSIPDDLECVMKKDRVEIDMGDAHVVLQLKEVSDGRIERYL